MFGCSRLRFGKLLPAIICVVMLDSTPLKHQMVTSVAPYSFVRMCISVPLRSSSWWRRRYPIQVIDFSFEMRRTKWVSRLSTTLRRRICASTSTWMCAWRQRALICLETRLRMSRWMWHYITAKLTMCTLTFSRATCLCLTPIGWSYPIWVTRTQRFLIAVWNRRIFLKNTPRVY